jgi:hypothetical protein
MTYRLKYFPAPWFPIAFVENQPPSDQDEWTMPAVGQAPRSNGNEDGEHHRKHYQDAKNTLMDLMAGQGPRNQEVEERDDPVRMLVNMVNVVNVVNEKKAASLLVGIRSASNPRSRESASLSPSDWPGLSGAGSKSNQP